MIFGNYDGPLLLLISNKKQLISIDCSICYDEENFVAPTFDTILKADEMVEEIQISPNSKWALMKFKKDPEGKIRDPVVIDLTNESQ